MCANLWYNLIFSKTNDFSVAAKKERTTSNFRSWRSKSFERQVQLELVVRQRSGYTLCRAATPTSNIKFLSGNALMEASSQASSQSDPEFVWTPSIMRTKSNIKIGDAEYCHPFPSRMDSSQCWNFFRCKLGVDYKSANDVYCLRCCKKLKSKSGEPIKYSFHTLKWHNGYATSHLMKNVLSQS